MSQIEYSGNMWMMDRVARRESEMVFNIYENTDLLSLK